MEKDQARRAMYDRLLGHPVDPGAPGGELSQAEAFELVLPAVERLVRQVERTFQHYATSPGGERIERVFLSGEICTSRQLTDYLEEQLAVPSQLLDPMDPRIPALEGREVPERADDRMAYNLVIALALCGNAYTPNLLHTYRDREAARVAEVQKRAIFGLVAVMILAVTGVFFWNAGQVSRRGAEIEQLTARLAEYSPRMDELVLSGIAGKAGKVQADLKRLSADWETLAVLQEVVALTPAPLGLTSMRVDLGPPPLEEAKGSKEARSSEPAPRLVVLEGTIIGEQEIFEVTLATYLARLDSSPLFALPVVHERTIDAAPDGGKVLRFILHVNLV
jgi:hypothetical protein